MFSVIRRSTTWSKIQAKPIQQRRSRTASTARDQQGDKGADGLGLSKANGSKASQGQAPPSTPVPLGQGAAPTWRESKWWRAVEASNSPDGRAISLTDSWFSASEPDACGLVLLHPRVAVEIPRLGTTLSWASFRLVWIRRFRDAALIVAPGRSERMESVPWC